MMNFPASDDFVYLMIMFLLVIAARKYSRTWELFIFR